MDKAKFVMVRPWEGIEVLEGEGVYSVKGLEVVEVG